MVQAPTACCGSVFVRMLFSARIIKRLEEHQAVWRRLPSFLSSADREIPTAGTASTQHRCQSDETHLSTCINYPRLIWPRCGVVSSPLCSDRPKSALTPLGLGFGGGKGLGYIKELYIINIIHRPTFQPFAAHESRSSLTRSRSADRGQQRSSTEHRSDPSQVLGLTYFSCALLVYYLFCDRLPLILGPA